MNTFTVDRMREKPVLTQFEAAAASPAFHTNRLCLRLDSLIANP